MQTLGYTDDPSSAHISWTDFIHPEDVSSFLSHYNKHLESKGQLPFEAEIRAFHKDQHIVDVYFRGKITHWAADGITPVKIAGICMDISKHKQAERALIAHNREYEELHQEQLTQAEELTKAIAYQKDIIFELESKERKLKEVQQLTGVGYFISYRNSDHLVWSSELYTQFGIDPSETPLAKTVYWSMVHPDDREKNLAALKRAEAGEEVHFEVRIIRKDNSLKYIKASAKPWKDEQDNIIGIYGGSADITAIKATQQEMSRNEALKKAVFNSSTDALLIVDVADNKILECNETTISLFELEHKEDILGLQMDALQRQPFSNTQFEHIYTELSTKNQWSAEVEFSTKKNKCFWGNLSISRMEMDGHPMAIARISDITERIKLKELLAKTQEIATIGGWEYDLQTQKITWTDEMYHIYGLEKGAEITADTIFTHCASEHIELIKNNFSRIIKEGGIADFEMEIINANYQQSWMRVIATAHRENNRTIKLSGTLQNIDHQKKQEFILKSKQSQLRAFVEAAPAAIAMFDYHLHYIAASEKWYEDYHLLDQKILGKSHYEVFPSLSEEWKETFERCLHGAIEQREEDKNELEDGTIQWQKWEVRPWFDSIGEIGGVITGKSAVPFYHEP